MMPCLLRCDQARAISSPKPVRKPSVTKSIRPASLAFLLAFCALSQCTSHFDGLMNDTSWIDSNEELYFLGIDSDSGWLFSVRFDGSAKRRLGTAPVRAYVLSPDGAWIVAVHRDSTCEVIEAKSGQASRIHSSCRSADWSPSGVRLLIVRADGSIGIYDRQTLSLREVVGPSEVGRTVWWAKEGDRFYSCEFLGECNCYDVFYQSGKSHSLGEYEDESVFWHDVIGVDNLHFNQYDSALLGRSRSVSPSGELLAETREGSLWVSSMDDGDEMILLKEVSYSGPTDWGPQGFWNPYWSADERYILGEADDRILLVDRETGQAGVVTRGRHPLVWLPGYRPSPGRNVSVTYYGFLKEAGY